MLLHHDQILFILYVGLNTQNDKKELKKKMFEGEDIGPLAVLVVNYISDPSLLKNTSGVINISSKSVMCRPV